MILFADWQTMMATKNFWTAEYQWTLTRTLHVYLIKGIKPPLPGRDSDVIPNNPTNCKQGLKWTQIYIFLDKDKSSKDISKQGKRIHDYWFKTKLSMQKSLICLK